LADNDFLFLGHMVDSLIILQIGSVFFGTVLAAPLMISKKVNKRI